MNPRRKALALAPPPAPRRAWARPAPAVAPPPALAPGELARRAELLTMPELAAYVKYLKPEDAGDPQKVRVAANSAYCFAKRHRIRIHKRGTVALVRVGDVDRYLETGSSDFAERAAAGRR